jgi:hypothetical protein
MTLWRAKRKSRRVARTLLSLKPAYYSIMTLRAGAAY